MTGGFAGGRISKAICGRCNVKHPYPELRPDSNVEGLRVCKDCWDMLDPYRLPARQPDNFILRYPRPDVPLVVTPYILNQDGEYISTEESVPLDQENP